MARARTEYQQKIVEKARSIKDEYLRTTMLVMQDSVKYPIDFLTDGAAEKMVDRILELEARACRVMESHCGPDGHQIPDKIELNGVEFARKLTL